MAGLGRKPRRVEAERLRFGFTVDDVDHLVRGALKHDAWTRGMDVSDRRDAAWFGVVEALYSADEPPARSDLLAAAIRGLGRLHADDCRTRGFAKVDRVQVKAAGPGTAPGFARYWLPPAHQVRDEAPFATALVDRLALRQVFAVLTRQQREALLALALHRDYERAADALSLSKTAFSSRLDRARAEFLSWWHEHETPARRPADRRTGRHGLRPAVAAVLAEDQIPGVLVPDVRAVFGRLAVDRIRNAVLLAELAAARPAIYGQWDLTDLASALRVCDIPPRQVTVNGSKCNGYRLDNVRQASEAAREDMFDDCDVILAAWLDQEHADPGEHPHAQVLRLVLAAGPDGITLRALTRALDGRAERGTIAHWLVDDVASGAVARHRSRYGAYVAPHHDTAAPAREPAPLPPDHPRMRMLAVIREAGPITKGALLDRLDGSPSALTVGRWLNQEQAAGTVIKVRHGVYAAARTDHEEPGRTETSRTRTGVMVSA